MSGASFNTRLASASTINDVFNWIQYGTCRKLAISCSADRWRQDDLIDDALAEYSAYLWKRFGAQSDQLLNLFNGGGWMSYTQRYFRQQLMSRTSPFACKYGGTSKRISKTDIEHLFEEEHPTASDGTDAQRVGFGLGDKSHLLHHLRSDGAEDAIAEGLFTDQDREIFEVYIRLTAKHLRKISADALSVATGKTLRQVRGARIRVKKWLNETLRDDA